VLRQSATVMQRSFHALHAEGRVQLHMAHQSAQLRVTGDCVVKPRYLAFQFWSRGSSFVNGVLGRVNAHYITIKRHTWLRSPARHNTWQRADADQGGLLGLYLCPAFSMLWPGMVDLVPRAQNLGAVDLGTRKVWHIRIRGSSFTMDVYVDQRSHYWVRLVSDGRGPPRQHAVFDYSGFNEKVTIKRPTVGASSP
jgi:hypothetical protein